MKNRKYLCDWLDQNQSWLIVIIFTMVIIISMFLVFIVWGDIFSSSLELFIGGIAICVSGSEIITIALIQIIELLYHRSYKKKEEKK